MTRSHRRRSIVAAAMFARLRRDVAAGRSARRGSVSAARGSASRDLARHRQPLGQHRLAGRARAATRRARKSASKTDEGYNVNKTVHDRRAARRRRVSKDVNVEDREVEQELDDDEQVGPVGDARARRSRARAATRRSRATPRRARGREASADLVAGRNRYGQPAVAGASTRSTTATTTSPPRATRTAAGHEGGGRALRRQGHDDAALGLPHDHLLRPALLLVRRAPTTGPTRYHGVHHYYPVPRAVLRLLQPARPSARS